MGSANAAVQYNIHK